MHSPVRSGLWAGIRSVWHQGTVRKGGGRRVWNGNSLGTWHVGQLRTVCKQETVKHSNHVFFFSAGRPSDSVEKVRVSSGFFAKKAKKLYEVVQNQASPGGNRGALNPKQLVCSELLGFVGPAFFGRSALLILLGCSGTSIRFRRWRPVLRWTYSSTIVACGRGDQWQHSMAVLSRMEEAGGGRRRRWCLRFHRCGSAQHVPVEACPTIDFVPGRSNAW